jgi:hypothetical protein
VRGLPPAATLMALSIAGVDFAWGRVPYDALRRAGVHFAIGYVSHDPSKDLSAGETHELHKRGIATALVFETTSGRALAGNEAGRADGRVAKARAAALGLTGPIYFAVDFDAQGAQLHAIDNYLAGAGSVLGHERVGVYGSYAVVNHCKGSGSAHWCWQTYAWSGGHVSQWADVYQHRNGVSIGGLSCDLDRATARGYGAMHGAGEDPRRLRRWLRRRRRELRVTVGRERRLRRRVARLERRLKRAQGG